MPTEGFWPKTSATSVVHESHIIGGSSPDANKNLCVRPTGFYPDPWTYKDTSYCYTYSATGVFQSFNMDWPALINANGVSSLKVYMRHTGWAPVANSYRCSYWIRGGSGSATWNIIVYDGLGIVWVTDGPAETVDYVKYSPGATPWTDQDFDAATSTLYLSNYGKCEGGTAAVFSANMGTITWGPVEAPYVYLLRCLPYTFTFFEDFLKYLNFLRWCDPRRTKLDAYEGETEFAWRDIKEFKHVAYQF
jgi:hypothetical protein